MNIVYKDLLPRSPSCDHNHVAFTVPATIPQVGEEFEVSVECKSCPATVTRTLTYTG